MPHWTNYQRESETKSRIVGWKGREVLPGPIRFCEPHREARERDPGRFFAELAEALGLP
jgi:hypothetical protein